MVPRIVFSLCDWHQASWVFGCHDLFSPFRFRLDDFMTIIPFPALCVRRLNLALGGCMDWSSVAFGIYGVLRGGRCI